MRFLVDRCAGRRLAEWLSAERHDVVDVRDEGPDPGDVALLARAVAEGRILVTLDTDFGRLIYREGEHHAGMVRLPDVPATRRIELMDDVLRRHAADLQSGALITVRGGRIRVSRPASRSR